MISQPHNNDNISGEVDLVLEKPSSRLNFAGVIVGYSDSDGVSRRKRSRTVRTCSNCGTHFRKVLTDISGQPFRSPCAPNLGVDAQ